MGRWFHYLTVIVFIVFGIIQFNDPDFWIWTPVYWLIALIPVLFLRNMLTQKLLLLFIVLYGLFMISYIPDIVDWINGGMDNIAGSMKAEEPHIELAREFFGLVICLSVIVIYYFKNKSKLT